MKIEVDNLSTHCNDCNYDKVKIKRKKYRKMYYIIIGDIIPVITLCEKCAIKLSAKLYDAIK